MIELLISEVAGARGRSSACSVLGLLALFVMPGRGMGPCGGDVPAFADCESGLFRADCGGTGPTTFACARGGDCVWFATSCVAREFEPSDCPRGLPCCHGTTGHTWPFSDSWDSANYTEVVSDIAACSSEPVTASLPAPITVSLDPSVSPPATSHVVCAAVPAPDYCDATGFAPNATGDGGVTVAIQSQGLRREVLLLEIVGGTSGSLGARVFTRVTRDGVAGPYCEAGGRPRPASQVTGTLTLSSGDLSRPDLLHGRGELLVDATELTVLF